MFSTISSRKGQSSGFFTALLLVASIFVLAGIGLAGLKIYTFNKEVATPSARPVAPAPASTETTGEKAPADPSGPTAAYLAFHAALKQGDFETMKKYAPTEGLKEFEEAEKSGKLKELLDVMQGFLPQDIEILSEEITGDTAVITAKGKGMMGGESHGTITMKKEGDAWKITKEDWKETDDVEEDAGSEEAAPAGGPPAVEDEGAREGSPEWLEDLSNAVIPDTNVAGIIHGKKFTLEKAVIDQANIITLRQGKDFFADLELMIFPFLKEGEVIEGKTYNISKDTGFGSPHVHMKWKPADADVPKSEVFMDKYVMRLEFGKAANGKVPGKIYLCLPDDLKSVVAGKFDLERE